MKRVTIFKRIKNIEINDEVYIDISDLKILLDKSGSIKALVIKQNARVFYTLVSPLISLDYIKVRRTNTGCKLVKNHLNEPLLHIYDTEIGHDTLVSFPANEFTLLWYDDSHPTIKLDLIFEQVIQGNISHDDPILRKTIEDYFIFHAEFNLDFIAKDYLYKDLRKKFENKGIPEDAQNLYVKLLFDRVIEHHLDDIPIINCIILIELAYVHKGFESVENFLRLFSRYDQLVKHVSTDEYKIIRIILSVSRFTEELTEYPHYEKFISDVKNDEANIEAESDDVTTYSKEELTDEIDFILDLPSRNEKEKERLKVLYIELAKRETDA